jgi:AraC-like DNA-binding protein
MPARGYWLESRCSMRLVKPFVSVLSAHAPPEGLALAPLAAASPDGRIPVRVALRMLEQAVQVTGLEALGVLAAEAMEHGGCDVLQFVAASAPDLAGALDAVIRYVRILDESAQPRVAERDGRVLMELHRPGARSATAADFQLGLLARGARALLGSLSGFEFRFRRARPTVRTPYLQLFAGAELRFDAPSDAVTCPAALLGRPSPQRDPALQGVLLRHAEHLLGQVPASPSIVPRVRDALAALLASADIDSERVAARLGMSRRSLNRHLEREGVRYSELLEQLRHELALHQLRSSDRDVQEIAYALGYSLTAAFSRAFRRWEGKSPNEYRRALAGVGVLETARVQ